MTDYLFPESFRDCFRAFFDGIEKKMEDAFFTQYKEPNMVSVLCDKVNAADKSVLESCLSNVRGPKYAGVKIFCKPNTYSGNLSESKTGFDFGIYIEIEHPEYGSIIKKACLIQAKKLYCKKNDVSRDKKYEEFDNPDQIESMKEITCDAYHMFFNPTGIKYRRRPYPIGIITSKILKGVKPRPSFMKIAKFMTNFKDFMADGMVGCPKGDSRAKAIEAATGKDSNIPTNYCLYVYVRKSANDFYNQLQTPNI